MLTWLKETMKETWKQIIAVVVVATGLGAAIWAAVKYMADYATDLISTKTTFGVALLLIALVYLLGRLNEKSKWKPKNEEPKIIQQTLVPIGNLKWDVTYYSDYSFDIAPLPYCHKHSTRLIEQHAILYVCPVDPDCPSVNYMNLSPLQQQAESLIEAHLRERRQTAST